MKYVVTRLMRYEYDTVEEALADMLRWGVPPTGAKRFNDRATIHSAVIGPLPDDGSQAVTLKEE